MARSMLRRRSSLRSGEDANHRPLLSFVHLIEDRDSVALSRSRLEFNFGVVSAVYKSASEGKPVHVQPK